MKSYYAIAHTDLANYSFGVPSHVTLAGNVEQLLDYDKALEWARAQIPEATTCTIHPYQEDVLVNLGEREVGYDK